MAKFSKMKLGGWVVIHFIIISLVTLPASQAGLAEGVFEIVLPNALKVILLENHKAPLITFQVWYRVGSRNEEWGKTGLSHMLEHMMFKGTKKFGPEEFSRIIQENGGNDNAFTTRDFTAYFENLSADRVRVVLDLEVGPDAEPHPREEDFRTERMVVMEERRLRTEDDPQAFLWNRWRLRLFRLQPYHWPIIGWMEDIARFTLEDLKNYYQTYYNPANAFLVVVGRLPEGRFIPPDREGLRLHPPREPRRIRKKTRDPKQVGERRILVKKEAQLPFLVMGYHVPNLRAAG